MPKRCFTLNLNPLTIQAIGGYKRGEGGTRCHRQKLVLVFNQSAMVEEKR